VIVLIIKVDDLDPGLAIRNVSRQFLVTKRLQVPLRSPVNCWALRLGTAAQRKMSRRPLLLLALASNFYDAPSTTISMKSC
jgi:hypothetical protein